jgi:undecaprenyl pyrophosphate synthase
MTLYGVLAIATASASSEVTSTTIGAVLIFHPDPELLIRTIGL